MEIIKNVYILMLLDLCITLIALEQLSFVSKSTQIKRNQIKINHALDLFFSMREVFFCVRRTTC